MKVLCENGYYKFYTDGVNELIQFADIFGQELIKVGDFYTFPKLAELPDYSIEGASYGSEVTAIATYAGDYSDVFGKNKLKYDIEKDKIVTNTETSVVGEKKNNYTWVVTGIPQAYGQLQDKQRIIGFEGFIDLVRGYTLVSRWQYENV